MHKNNIVVLSFLLSGIMLGAIGTFIFLNIFSGKAVPPGSGGIISPNISPTQAPLPFPLDDMSGEYKLLEHSQNSYILSYTTASGTRQDIYADPSQLSDYRDYLNSSILVKGYMKTIKKQVQCIRAPCDPIEQQILVITRLQLKPQPMTPISPVNSPKDKRCFQKATFSGNCMMYLTGTEYDENKNECVSVGGGGCTGHAPFASVAECRKLCVDGWNEQSSATGYEKILYSGGFKYGSPGELIKFDAKGEAVLKTIGSSVTRYTLINGFEINDDIYKMVAVVEQTTTTTEKNSVSADYQGTFLQGYHKNELGELISEGERLSFEAPGTRVENVTMTQSGDRLTFEFGTVPCGGSAPLPCGEKKKKTFTVGASTILPAD